MAQKWKIKKTCSCGTVIVVEHEIDGLTTGLDVLEGGYLTALSMTRPPASVVCGGCHKRHRFDQGFKEVNQA